MMSMEERDNSLPAGWRPINVEAQTIYIHDTAKIATTTKGEITKKKPRRNTKVSCESGTYVIQPQPRDLPPGWERAVAVNPDGSTGVYVYHNVSSGRMSMQRPVPEVKTGGNGPLPAGWVVGYDEEGDVYFEDRNSGTVTYDDPRLVSKYSKFSKVEQLASLQLKAKTAEDDYAAIAKKLKKLKKKKKKLEKKEKKANKKAAKARKSAIALSPWPEETLQMPPTPPPRARLSLPAFVAPKSPSAPAMGRIDEDKAVENKDDDEEEAAEGANVDDEDEDDMPDDDAIDSDGSDDDFWQIGRIDHGRFNNLAQHLTPKNKLPAEVVTKAMNRYTNILPNPRTRILLEDDHMPYTAISTYINANYVPGHDLNPHSYVAAMGPLDHTIEAFWRMIWMVDAPTIIMTTPMAEKGVIKCARYWPTVRYNEEKKCGDKRWGDFRVAVMKGQKRNGYIITHLRLTKGSDVRYLRHYWFTDWPDHGVPKSATNVIDMLKDARNYTETESSCKGPMVVHCSAGIGRTGTFIAIEHCIKQLEETGRTEPLEVVSALRRARGGMVQHPQQYEFVQRACMEYAINQGKTVRFLDSAPPSDSGSESTPGEERRREKGRKSSNIFGKKKSEKGGSGDCSNDTKKDINWKNSIKSKKAAVWEELIERGKPDDMPDDEWKKLVRKYCKTQSTLRAKHSMRRTLDPAELDGELRLGTLSGGTALLKSRPSAKALFDGQDQ